MSASVPGVRANGARAAAGELRIGGLPALAGPPRVRARERLHERPALRSGGHCPPILDTRLSKNPPDLDSQQTILRPQVRNSGRPRSQAAVTALMLRSRLPRPRCRRGRRRRWWAVMWSRRWGFASSAPAPAEGDVRTSEDRFVSFCPNSNHIEGRRKREALEGRISSSNDRASVPVCRPRGACPPDPPSFPEGDPRKRGLGTASSSGTHPRAARGEQPGHFRGRNAPAGLGAPQADAADFPRP